MGHSPPLRKLYKNIAKINKTITDIESQPTCGINNIQIAGPTKHTMAKFFLILVNEMWWENFFSKYNDNSPVINNDGSADVFIIEL